MRQVRVGRVADGNPDAGICHARNAAITRRPDANPPAMAPTETG